VALGGATHALRPTFEAPLHGVEASRMATYTFMGVIVAAAACVPGRQKRGFLSLFVIGARVNRSFCANGAKSSVANAIR
jgi:hypothetical protein